MSVFNLFFYGDKSGPVVQSTKKQFINGINDQVNNGMNTNVTNGINGFNEKVKNGMNANVTNGINGRLNNGINDQVNNGMNANVNNGINPVQRPKVLPYSSKTGVAHMNHVPKLPSSRQTAPERSVLGYNRCGYPAHRYPSHRYHTPGVLLKHPVSGQSVSKFPAPKESVSEHRMPINYMPYHHMPTHQELKHHSTNGLPVHASFRHPPTKTGTHAVPSERPISRRPQNINNDGLYINTVAPVSPHISHHTGTNIPSSEKMRWPLSPIHTVEYGSVSPFSPRQFSSRGHIARGNPHLSSPVRNDQVLNSPFAIDNILDSRTPFKVERFKFDEADIRHYQQARGLTIVDLGMQNQESTDVDIRQTACNPGPLHGEKHSDSQKVETQYDAKVATSPTVPKSQIVQKSLTCKQTTISSASRENISGLPTSSEFMDIPSDEDLSASFTKTMSLSSEELFPALGELTFSDISISIDVSHDTSDVLDLTDSSAMETAQTSPTVLKSPTVQKSSPVQISPTVLKSLTVQKLPIVLKSQTVQKSPTLLKSSSEQKSPSVQISPTLQKSPIVPKLGVQRTNYRRTCKKLPQRTRHKRACDKLPQLSVSKPKRFKLHFRGDVIVDADLPVDGWDLKTNSCTQDGDTINITNVDENSVIAFDVNSQAVSDNTAAVSDIPDMLDIPAVSDIPAVADIAGLSDISAVADNPAVTDVPDVLDISDVADIPAVADVPTVSDIPAVADISAVSVNDNSNTKSAINRKTRLTGYRARDLVFQHRRQTPHTETHPLGSAKRVRHIMNDWYQDNRYHPFISESKCAELATKAGVTKQKIRKWLADKRYREKKFLSNFEKIDQSEISAEIDELNYTSYGSCME